MKKNLVEYVGRPYFAERFAGCMFYLPDGRAAYINNQKTWPKDQVVVNVINGDAVDPKLTMESLSWDFFTGMEVFATPPLGWRMADNGKYMVHLRRRNVGSQNRYARGLNWRILDKTVSPVTTLLIDTENVSASFFNKEPTMVALVMKPEYYPLLEGLGKMRAGEFISFCVNPNLAVIPESDEQQAILFNTNKVATINAKNQVKSTNPLVTAMIKDHL